MKYYEIDGKRYPRVTAVLDIIHRPELEHWRAELGNVEADRISNETAQTGVCFHHICRLFNRDQSFDIPATSRLGQMLAAYREWFEAAVNTVVDTEKLVVSKRFGYAGTLDLLAVLKGDTMPSVIDLKTSKSFWPTMALQLAAYRQALLEEGREVDRRLVIRIDRVEAGKLQVREFTQHAKDLNAFLAALTLFRYFEK